MSTKVYEIITARIIEKLEAGTVPWKKPWNGADEAPSNFISKKPYRGVNAFLTSMSGFTSPYWLTFKQAKDLGGTVRKGETGTPVIFWNTVNVSDNPDDEKHIPFARYYTVFNLQQIDGITVSPPADVAPMNFNPIEACETIVKKYATIPRVQHVETRAYYSPSLDYINMPPKEVFHSVPEYYSTLFHELTHSTGHKDRLNRQELQHINSFGDHSYTKEELTAEMGSAFLCAIAGIEAPVIDNQSAYIRGWLSKLRSDCKFVIQAAGRAQKASDYVLGIKPETTHD